MSSEPPAEAHDTRQPATDHQAGEPPPAFWRAQGLPAESPGRDPASVVIDGEAAVKDPAMTGAQQPGSAPGGARTPAATGAGQPGEARTPAATGAGQPGEARTPAATGADQPAAAAITPERWSEILVAFVDDPRGSVKMAADAVDEAIDEFVNSVRARQRALASSCEGPQAGTEELRTALRDYRKLWHQVRQLDLGGKTGA
jgi:hypothetical protein